MKNQTPNIEALRETYNVTVEMGKLLEKVAVSKDWGCCFEEEVRSQLSSDIRRRSGFGRELWKLRLWAIHSAGESVARFLGCDNPNVLTSALCWMAQQGYDAKFAVCDNSCSTYTTTALRAVPVDFLERIYTRTRVVTEAAGIPSLSTRPLSRRFVKGADVWNAAFATLTIKETVEPGLYLLFKTTDDLLEKVFHECNPTYYVAREYLYHADYARKLWYRQKLLAEWEKKQATDNPKTEPRYEYLVRWFPEGLVSTEEGRAHREVLQAKLLGNPLLAPVDDEYKRVADILDQIRQREHDAALAELGLQQKQ